jgi:hypothetical protein
MLEPRSSVHTATAASAPRRMPAARVAVPRRAVAAAALLALLLGYVLSQVLTAQRPSLTAAVRHRPARPQHGLSSLPLGAQGPISGALGADEAAYHIRASRGGFQAANPAQRLKESFDPSGVVVGSGKSQLGLSLRAVGYGNSLAALPAAPPRATANRVTYAYPGLSAWYRNGPLGLEQGFTITRAPSAHPAGPLTLSLALSGNVHASLGSGRQSLTLKLAGGPSLRYGGLQVSDARGRTLHSWLELRAGGVLLRTDTQGARYPLRVDPFIQQGEKLSGTGQSGPITPSAGYSVALSSDGNTALIGGPGDYGDTGAAWVFTRSGSTWSQQGPKLAGTGASGESRFGASVALTTTGGTTAAGTALIGGPSDNNGDGAAWVFTRSEGKWTQQGSKLTGSGEVGNSAFGSSVALSADGSTALMGGPSDARIVETEGEVTEKSKLVKGLSSTTGIEVGSEVNGTNIEPETTVTSVKTKEVELSAAVEGEGSAKVKEKLTFTTDVGAAWAFTRSGSTWTQQGSKLSEPLNGSEKLEVGNGALGSSVALSSNGNTALIGGPGDNKGAGAAWVYTRLAEKWTALKSKLTGSGEVTTEALPGEFGASVALASSSGVANTALIGGPGDTKGLGAAWVFTFASEKWTQQAELKGAGEVSEEPGENKFPGEFGASVALSSSESPTATSTALIGGPGDNKGAGAAWAFLRSVSTWSAQGSKLTGSDEVGSEEHPGEFGAGVALSSDGNTALMGGPGDNSKVGAAWVFTRSGSTWTQQGSKLTGTGASARSAGRFGASVALSSDGNTALIGGPEDGRGGAWVFTRSGTTWTQQGSKLTGGEEAGEHIAFGASVALSSDGNTALVGGPGDRRMFEREGEVTEKSKIVKGLTSTTGISTGLEVSGTKIEFGTFVAKVINEHELELNAKVEGEGSATVKEQLTFTEVGAAWVFTRSGSTWTQQGPKLTGTGGIGEATLGATVALSSDGNTALIGGPGDKNLTGAAWVFTRSGSTWTQQGSKLTGSGETGFTVEFGSSVALSAEGNTALIGAPFDNGAKGAAWVFTRSGSTWTQQGSKLTGSGATGLPEFATSLALSANGNTALIGGPGDNIEVGAAWAFTRSGSTWTQQGSKLTGTGETGRAQFATSLALAASGDTALIGGPIDTSKAGAVWVFTRSGSTWTQQGSKLTGAGEAGTASDFGQGVALSSEGNTALIGGPGDYSNTGAAWVFFQNFPTAVTEPASSVTLTSATLNASVNPDGSEVSKCEFEYGTTTAYGKTALCTPAPGSGTSPVAVSAAVGGLTAHTTYHFRISATNAGGTSTGSDRTFNTTLPPTVATEAASAVTQTSATVNATVNPNNAQVSDCRFEYGTTEAYGSSAPCAQSLGSGETPVAVSAALESLAEGATYHFRISATNAGGTSLGADRTFTTLLVLGPHWYVNNVRLGESALESGLIVMGWGNLTLQNTGIGAFTCQTLAGGDIADPVGGGAGKGSFDGFAAYDCEAPACEAVKGLLQVIPEKLKWSSVLIEEAGTFRDRIEGIALRAVCVGGTSNVEFHGMLKPELEAGTAQGAAPAKLEFGAGSGSLQSEEGAGNVSARLKFMGFEGGEILRAKKT